MLGWVFCFLFAFCCGDGFDVDGCVFAGGFGALAGPAVEAEFVIGSADGFDHVVDGLVAEGGDA